MLETILTRLTLFSTDCPKTVLVLTLAAALGFTAQLPRAVIDTDPKHMLPVSSPVRQFNDQVERDFALHADVIAVGIVNPTGIANPATLERIARLTRQIQAMQGVVARDVVSLSALDDITLEGATLRVRPVLEEVPRDAAGLAAMRQALTENPLLSGRIVSSDLCATAIYVPLEPGANGKELADAIGKLLGDGPPGEQTYIAGDPVARDTFGAEMFRQMALFSPVAGMLMCAILWLMFRSWSLVALNMAVAMVSIVGCLGLLVGLGFPIHIMSSMSPVFLMAIATDSVHIFNEFRYRIAGGRKRRQAVLETMAAVARPVFFSDVTTAVGFAALATASIVPVKVFGLFVGFGTLVLLISSFTLVPAVLAMLPEGALPPASAEPLTQPGQTSDSPLGRLGRFCTRRAPAIAVLSLVLLAAAVAGLLRIRVNNNMVHWFKADSPVRIADRVLNERLGGTSTGYLVLESDGEDAMKDPAMLRYVEGLQRALEKQPLVGRTFSVVDYVCRINQVLHDGDRALFRVPDTAEEVGQYLFLFGMSAKPSDLQNVVDGAYRRVNVVLQLKSWDAGVMRGVIAAAESHLMEHPAPRPIRMRPAGIAAFNLVWSDEVLWGMLESFLSGLVLVFMLLVLQTRSWLWGGLMFVPLLVTIAVLYGAVGLLGKDFDMPVAVLSTLSLGLAIDFAIHFVERFRDRYRESPELLDALVWTVERPGRGILLNAGLFAAGFAVMLFADLTPYVTVGVLMIAIMLLSALLSVVLLPGLVRLLSRFLLKGLNSCVTHSN